MTSGLDEYVRKHGNEKDRHLMTAGRDVRPRALTLIAGELADRLRAALTPREVGVFADGQPEYGALTIEARKNPGMDSERLRAQVSSIVGDFLQPLPKEVSMQVLPVQRVTWNGTAVARAKREGEPIPPRECSTVVAVRVVAPRLGERLVFVSTEPMGRFRLPKPGQAQG